jgi:uncharacterized protein YbjQ (UPF0145 family)
MWLQGRYSKRVAGDEYQARQEASQESIRAGGLPLNAVDRLREQRARQGKAGHIFTSDLSASELLLTKECGFEPLGQVMGSSVYHVGFQPNMGFMYATGELAVLTQAHYSARHLAMNRLAQEAKLLGADGVVGVRLTQQAYDWGTSLIEFAAVGTAVRRIGAPPLAPGQEPFLSALSGQDHWTMLKSGYRPVGFSFGNCTWYQVASWSTQIATSGGLFGTAWYNQELTDYTQGYYTARELAISRMEHEAYAVGADGIIGVTLDVYDEAVEIGGNSHRRDMIIHYTALGTCVAKDESMKAEASAKPLMMMDIRRK